MPTRAIAVPYSLSTSGSRRLASFLSYSATTGSISRATKRSTPESKAAIARASSGNEKRVAAS